MGAAAVPGRAFCCSEKRDNVRIVFVMMGMLVVGRLTAGAARGGLAHSSVALVKMVSL